MRKIEGHRDLKAKAQTQNFNYLHGNGSTKAGSSRANDQAQASAPTHQPGSEGGPSGLGEPRPLEYNSQGAPRRDSPIDPGANWSSRNRYGERQTRDERMIGDGNMPFRPGSSVPPSINWETDSSVGPTRTPPSDRQFPDGNVNTNQTPFGQVGQQHRDALWDARRDFHPPQPPAPGTHPSFAQRDGVHGNPNDYSG